MKKPYTKLAAVLLALVMIFTVLPVSAFAEEPILIVPAPIEGITVPVKDATPTPAPGTALPDGTGYTVKLDSWLDGDRNVLEVGESFDAGTLYAARVMLTAKEGYAFEHNTGDQATIDYGQRFRPTDATVLSPPLRRWTQRQICPLSCKQTAPSAMRSMCGLRSIRRWLRRGSIFPLPP